jgi:hypothetical protein
MAKISAHGATKLAEGYYDFDFGSSLGVARNHYVLRSDGAILKASSYPNAERSYDRRRTSYRKVAKFKAEPTIDGFRRYVTKRALQMESVAVFK